MDNQSPAYFNEEKIRLKKILRLRQQKINPFPSQVTRSKTIEEVLINFSTLLKRKTILNLVGRIISIRRHGGSTFLHLQDESDKIQAYFKKDEVGDKAYQLLNKEIDPGDFLQITGHLFTTKKGEKTVLVEKFIILAKAILPLPEKWHGLVDTELRLRKRYLDLLANPETVALFKKRALIIKAIRQFLNQEGFLEVETPILQPLPGGATAKPFVTEHHALKEKLYLRVAPELYLKRLIVGGFEKVYEIGRCFRNEGIDWTHNPEFTMLEFYQAYWDYQELMKFTEKLFLEILNQVEKKELIDYQRQKINFLPPYPRIKFKDAIKKETGIDLDKIKNKEKLMEKAKTKGLKIEKNFSQGKIIDELYKDFVRPKLIQPTFLIDYPLTLSPLAKKIEDNPNYVERFQLIAGGQELTNCFSELNDPNDQFVRFQEQEKLRKAGDEEAQRIDYDYLEALKHGLPPTAGFGLGIDRLVALLCNVHSLKEVILFPTLKKEK